MRGPNANGFVLQLSHIFHCNVKPLAFGRRFGLDPQRDNLRWRYQCLADPTPSLEDPTPSLADPSEPVEYSLQWVSLRWGSHWPCRFHVVCVNFICVGYSKGTQFPVEYGLKCSQHKILCVFCPNSTNKRHGGIIDISMYSTGCICCGYPTQPKLRQTT